MECSSNVVHLRTCVDSCVALRDLLVYLACNGDLSPPGDDGREVRPYSSLGSDLVSAPSSMVCVCVCVHACVHCICVCVYACVCMCEHPTSLSRVLTPAARQLHLPLSTRPPPAGQRPALGTSSVKQWRMTLPLPA